MKIEPTTAEINAALRSDLMTFAEKAFETLNPGSSLKSSWHHEAIAEFLRKVDAGEIKRGIINSCPRSLKSTIISVAWPAYCLGHDPTRTFLVVSHSQELATELASQSRKIMTSAWYTSAFPTMKGKADKNNALVFTTSKGGGRRATSVNSSVTGLGARDIIIDDPIDASLASNPTQCAATNDWITRVLLPRLNDKTTGTILLVMQRISVHDTTAHLQALPSWKSLVLPAVAPKDMNVPISSDQAYSWKQGDLLHPELLGNSVLDELRSSLGDADFVAQYLQAPVPSGGGGINISKFKRYQKLPAAIDFWFLSIDASSGTESGSYSVIQVWAASNGSIYLYDQKRARLEFPELRAATIAIAAKFKARFIVVEAASAGLALLQELHAHYPIEKAHEMLVPIRPKLPKPVRMDQAMIMVGDGKVFLREGAAYTDTLIPELQAFPEGAHDDQVDALSQAVNWSRRFFAGPPSVGVSMIQW